MKTHPKLKFFKGFNENLKTVKARFKDLCFIHHPDVGGDVEMMKLINLEYEFIIKNCLFDFTSENEERFSLFPLISVGREKKSGEFNWSLLKGLIAREKTGGKRKFRLLYFIKF